MKQARTIDDVISILDKIIKEEVAIQSNLAIFPVLYKQVTERIKEGVVHQEFDDNPRMQRLDVIFANRYLDAYFIYKDGGKPSVCWLHAFEAAKDESLITLQHLLLGINAHINLDLGIAVSKTVGNTSDLPTIHNDFNKINAILSSMVDAVQKSIGTVSPLFFLLDRFAKGKEDAIAAFSINVARDGAWIFANTYHVSIDKRLAFERRDQVIGQLAAKLYTIKSRFLRFVIKIIRWFETKNINKVVNALGGK
jgi:hypothetical protein